MNLIGSYTQWNQQSKYAWLFSFLHHVRCSLYLCFMQLQPLSIHVQPLLSEGEQPLNLTVVVFQAFIVTHHFLCITSIKSPTEIAQALYLATQGD